MTEQEAINVFKGFKFTPREMKAVAMGVEALEKQIPKKPIPIDWEKYKDKIINAEYLRGGYWCPNCKHMIKSGKYCVDCGQAIDWGNENGRNNKS